MVYEEYKIYGPYVREDGRKHVIAVRYDYGKKIQKTISYPKYLVEVSLNRYLSEDETVDHKDRDFNNNSPDNLVVRKRSEHSSLDAVRVMPQEFECEYCSAVFALSSIKLNDAKHNRLKGKRGPFCSRRCAGKASQNIEQYSIKDVPIEHHFIDK